MYRTDFWTLREGEGGMFRENSIETCILSRVKQITSPGWMNETSAWTWCTGKTYREQVEREVGGGIGMGNTCKPMALSFQCMTKFTTNKKKMNYTLYILIDISHSKIHFDPYPRIMGIKTKIHKWNLIKQKLLHST